MSTEAQKKRPTVYAQVRAIASRLLSMGAGAGWSVPVRAATPLTLAAMREGVAEVDPHCAPEGTYAVRLSNGAQLALAGDYSDAPALVVLKGGKE